MVLAIERRNRRLGFLIAAHLDETEPLALASVSIVDHVRAFHCTMRSEQLFQSRVVNLETQISYVQFLTNDDLLELLNFAGRRPFLSLCDVKLDAFAFDESLEPFSNDR